MLQLVRQIVRHIIVVILITNTAANAQHRNNRGQRNTDPRSIRCKSLMNQIRGEYERELSGVPSDAQVRLRTGLARIESADPGRGHVRTLKDSSQQDMMALVYADRDEFRQINTEANIAVATSANFVHEQFRTNCDGTQLECQADESSIRVCTPTRPVLKKSCLQSDWSEQPPSHSSVPVTRRVLYIGERAFRSAQEYADGADSALISNYRQECRAEDSRQPGRRNAGASDSQRTGSGSSMQQSPRATGAH